MKAWDKLKMLTSARVGLGRTGASLPTQQILEFQRAHSAARNAVWLPWNVSELEQQLRSQGESPLLLTSALADRESYLRFPNKGRQLSGPSQELLKNCQTDLALVVSDGLSALAIDKHFLKFWECFKPLQQETFPELNYKLFLVPFARVALADEVGERSGAQLSVIFIGERPGLNSPDSMGIYLTFKPQRSNSDAQRNCISNVREPLGMSYPHAAHKLIYLMKESLRLQLSGVHLKDEMDLNLTAKSNTKDRAHDD